MITVKLSYKGQWLAVEYNHKLWILDRAEVLELIQKLQDAIPEMPVEIK